MLFYSNFRQIFKDQAHGKPHCGLVGNCYASGLSKNKQLWPVSVLSFISSRIQECERNVRSVVTTSGNYKLFYTRKVSFFLQFLDFIPEVLDSRGQRREPSELKMLRFYEKNDFLLILSCLSSSLFYWFNIINSDCRNLNKREILSFPIPLSSAFNSEELQDILFELMQDYKDNSFHRTVNYAKKGAVTVQYFNFRPSKPIIDKIDKVLAKHYGFTNEELDFIINYDIKYRMGIK